MGQLESDGKTIFRIDTFQIALFPLCEVASFTIYLVGICINSILQYLIGYENKYYIESTLHLFPKGNEPHTFLFYDRLLHANRYYFYSTDILVSK